MGNERAHKNEVTHYCYLLLQVLVIGFLLWLTVQPVEVRWADADVTLGMGIPVVGVVGFLCVLLNKAKPRVTIVDGLIIVWSIYYIGRVWLGAEYPCGVDFLKAAETVLLYFVLRAVMCDAHLSAWWLIGGIIACGAYEALLGVWQMITGSGRHHIFMLTGTFQNPGPYSAYLMIAAVMMLRLREEGALPEIEEKMRLQFRCYDKLARNIAKVFRYLLCAVALLPLLVLPSTWSRAAFVGLGLCALWIYRRKYWKRRYYVWGGIAVLAFAFYIIKRGSADGRAIIWMASLTSWMRDMWLGAGIGGFRNACAEGIAELWRANPDSGMFASAGVADYSYNALLKVLVEQGLVGATLCVATVAIAMARLYRQSAVLFIGMVSLLIFSLFSYPFELLPYTIIATMVIAWSESASDNDTLSLRLSKKMRTFALMLAVAISLFVKGEVEDRLRCDKEAQLFSGMRHSAFLTDYYELLHYEADNPQYLFDFAKVLRSEKRYMDSNAILRQATLVSADPMLYVIMGNNYSDEQFYDLAEESYSKAYAIMPNRLYPLHQLMVMYADMGEQAKAHGMAKTILSSYAKVESKATRQIRQKADSICRNINTTQHPDKRYEINQ